MDCSKTGEWIIPFQKFSKLKVNSDKYWHITISRTNDTLSQLAKFPHEKLQHSSHKTPDILQFQSLDYQTNADYVSTLNIRDHLRRRCWRSVLPKLSYFSLGEAVLQRIYRKNFPKRLSLLFKIYEKMSKLLPVFIPVYTRYISSGESKKGLNASLLIYTWSFFAITL